MSLSDCIGSESGSEKAKPASKPIKESTTGSSDSDEPAREKSSGSTETDDTVKDKTYDITQQYAHAKRKLLSSSEEEAVIELVEQEHQRKKRAKKICYTEPDGEEVPGPRP